MNPSGLWRGKAQNRVGHFKFINVELLPDRPTNSRGHRGRRERHLSSSSSMGNLRSKSRFDVEEDLISRNSEIPLSSNSKSDDRETDDTRDNRSDINATELEQVADDNDNAGDDLGQVGPRCPEAPKTVEDLLKRIGLEVNIIVSRVFS